MPRMKSARARLRALELRRRGAGRDEARELLVEGLLHRLQVAARLRVGEEPELARDLAVVDERLHARRAAILVNQPVVEPRGLPAGEDVEGEAEVRDVLRPIRRNVVHLDEPRLRHVVLHNLPMLALHLRDPRLVLHDGRPGRDVAEVPLHALADVIGAHVAGDDERRVRRAVVRAEPVLHVLQRRGVQVVHRPDHRPGVGMALRKGVLGDGDPRLAVRLVFSLPLLVLHHAALLVELRGVDRAEQVAHAVRLEPEDPVERGDGDVLEVVGAILVRRAVEVRRTDRLDRLEIVVVVVLAAVEHQVLEEVREAGLARLLVLRADVIPHVHGGDGRLVVLVHEERQAVLQGVLRVRNVRYRRRRGGARRSRRCGGLRACRAGDEHERARGEKWGDPAHAEGAPFEVR